jgi:hypothetical protein
LLHSSERKLARGVMALLQDPLSQRICIRTRFRKVNELEGQLCVVPSRRYDCQGGEKREACLKCNLLPAMSEDEYWDDSIDWHTVSETPALNSTHASTSTGANVTTTNPQEHSRATADMANPFYTERDTVGGRFTSSSRANVPLQASSSTSTQPSSSTMKRPVAESESVRKRRRQAILGGYNFTQLAVTLN